VQDKKRENMESWGRAMIGNSALFRLAVSLLRRFATTDAPILIEGDTGTGKELAAREVHYCSRRHSRPFVPVNCRAMPDALVEDELFGRESGAMTDAHSARAGLVEIAAGGTLFLDEVDTLAAKGQVTLLRFLQDQEFRAVGSTKFRAADVRVVAASTARLPELVERGLFRRDLFFRLNTLHVRLPPLREREGDVNVLTTHFLELAARRLQRDTPRPSPAALVALNNYSWPGNVRELESVLLQTVLLTEGTEIAASTLGIPPARDAAIAAKAVTGFGTGDGFDRFAKAKARAIRAFEFGYLSEVIRRSQGNVTLAAKLSGTERRQLGKLLKKHGITPKALNEMR
jgi:DNA-binding NtrC family response regulator